MDFQLLFSAFKAQPAHVRWPQQRQLHECLRQGIRSGTLASGTRLPASRTLAVELGVARNSVLYAYEQLATEGFIVATRRGSVVAPLAGRLVAGSKPVAPVLEGRSCLSRRAQNMPLLPGSETAAAFAPGVPALGDFPVVRWRRMLDKAWASLAPAQLNYADPAGEPALREAIAGHLRVARGALVDAAQVFITDGTQSSLDLCARAFADAGDKLWMENPGYQGAVAAFRAAQLKAVGIVVDADGMAPTASDWLRQRPRLIYTTPSHQYPVGSVMGLARRLALIDGARQAGALVIEDDYDSEFHYAGRPTACVQGLDPHDRTIYIGTFTKSLFPGLRIGYVVLPPHLVAPMTVARTLLDGHTASMTQLTLARFMEGGHFGAHVRTMRSLYAQRLDALTKLVTTHLSDFVEPRAPAGGLQLPCALTCDLSERDVVDAARRVGIELLGLSALHAAGDGKAGFLMGFAAYTPTELEDAVRTLERALRAVKRSA